VFGVRLLKHFQGRNMEGIIIRVQGKKPLVSTKTRLTGQFA